MIDTVICAKCNNRFSMYDYAKGREAWGETYLDITQKIVDPKYESMPVILCRDCENKVINFIFSAKEVEQSDVDPA